MSRTQPPVRLVGKLPDRTGALGVVVWVIYRNPTDYPGRYVLRKQLARLGEVWAEREPRAVGDTIEEIRGVLPDFLARMDRHPDDEPQIVETWV
jgi:hypothetical protein